MYCWKNIITSYCVVGGIAVVVSGVVVSDVVAVGGGVAI